MSIKTKSTIIKILAILVCAGIARMLILAFVVSWFIPKDIIEQASGDAIACYLLLPFLVPGILLCVLLIAWHRNFSDIVLTLEKTYPERISLDFKNYEEIENCVCLNLKKRRFTRKNQRELKGNGECISFVQHNIINNVVFVMIHTDELTKDKTDEIHEEIDYLYQKYKGMSLSGVFCLHIFACVEVTSSYFYEWLEQQNQSMLRTFYYRSAYSFGNKKLYLSSCEGTFAESRLKQMKKFIVKITE